MLFAKFSTPHVARCPAVQSPQNSRCPGAAAQSLAVLTAGALALFGLGFGFAPARAASVADSAAALGSDVAELQRATTLKNIPSTQPSTQPSIGFSAGPGVSGLSSTKSDAAYVLDDAGADRIFQGDDVISARSVSAFSRRTEPFGHPADGDAGGGGGHFRLLFDSTGSVLDLSGATSLQGAAIARTIFALQSSNLTTKTAPGPGAKDEEEFLAFWEGPQPTRSSHSASGDARTMSAAPASASDLSAPATVSIPLPTAIWSGLSVLGGYSVVAGWRKIRQLWK